MRTRRGASPHSTARNKLRIPSLHNNLDAESSRGFKNHRIFLPLFASTRDCRTGRSQLQIAPRKAPGKGRLEDRAALPRPPGLAVRAERQRSPAQPRAAQPSARRWRYSTTGRAGAAPARCSACFRPGVGSAALLTAALTPLCAPRGTARRPSHGRDAQLTCGSLCSAALL